MIFLHLMRICNVVSPIIVLLYTQFEVDLERPPVNQIWPEVMGIILAVNAWMVPFMKTFGVEKETFYLLLMLVLISHMRLVSW